MRLKSPKTRQKLDQIHSAIAGIRAARPFGRFAASIIVGINLCRTSTACRRLADPEMLWTAERNVRVVWHVAPRDRLERRETPLKFLDSDRRLEPAQS